MKDMPPNASNAEYASEVGSRIQAELNEQGWRQSDLWRALRSELGDEGSPGRDNVSKWVRGQTVPREANVREALCRVLNKELPQLFPPRDAGPPSFRVTDLHNGQAWLALNQAMDWSVAQEIIRAI